MYVTGYDDKEMDWQKARRRSVAHQHKIKRRLKHIDTENQIA
jgi:hypothetical protein